MASMKDVRYEQYCAAAVHKYLSYRMNVYKQTYLNPYIPATLLSSEVLSHSKRSESVV